MKPLISVNLPTFNRARFVKQAVDSLLQQTFTNWELNIVDNCSTDGTWEIVSSYKDSRIRTYRNEENKGMVFSWNRLIHLSRGQYVCYLADDDWFAPNRLERLLKFLQDDPECWGVCDYLIDVDENGNRIADGHRHYEGYFNRDVYNGDFHQALVNPINAEAIGLFKRAYYDEVGDFEEGVTFCDFRMHVRNLAKRLRIGSLPEQLHFKRQHANSATANMKDGLTFECFYLFKYVYKEIYLPDRNPLHLATYIKWLLFERAYQNMALDERRRLLYYVLGTEFPFDTFAEFHAHVTQTVPSVDVTNTQKAANHPPATEPARDDPAHHEMLRELVHFMVEKWLRFTGHVDPSISDAKPPSESDAKPPSESDAKPPSESDAKPVDLWGEIVRLNEVIVVLNKEIARRKNLNPLRKLERSVRKINPLRKLGRTVRKLIRG